jgi:hypothetical protein
MGIPRRIGTTADVIVADGEGETVEVAMEGVETRDALLHRLPPPPCPMFQQVLGQTEANLQRLPPQPHPTLQTCRHHLYRQTDLQMATMPPIPTSLPT